jgi:AhpD family alkylhydroperoxidase
MNAIISMIIQSNNAVVTKNTARNIHRHMKNTAVAQCNYLRMKFLCDGCIGDHVTAELKAGATKQELAETIDVAVLMGDGPAVIYGSQALAAVEELSAE